MRPRCLSCLSQYRDRSRRRMQQYVRNRGNYAIHGTVQHENRKWSTYDSFESLFPRWTVQKMMNTEKRRIFIFMRNVDKPERPTTTSSSVCLCNSIVVFFSRDFYKIYLHSKSCRQILINLKVLIYLCFVLFACVALLSSTSATKSMNLQDFTSYDMLTKMGKVLTFRG